MIRTALCRTVAENICELLTISNRKRPGVLIQRKPII